MTKSSGTANAKGASRPLINSVRTCHGQTIQIGSQVAYAAGKPDRTIHDWMPIPVLRVANVIQVIVAIPAFAEADACVELVLDDGETVDCTKVAVTDGRFAYAK